MAKTMEDMTLDKAVTSLESSELAKSEVAEVKKMVQQGKSGFLKQPKGYNALDGARKLLNSMIHETFEKYDKEVMKCVDFYYAQCAALYECRGQISEANYIAANGRSLILDSQKIINWCEVRIPTKKQELKDHNLKCEKELGRLNARLAIVMADIDVMVTLLEMTDCDAQNKAFVAMNLDVLKCSDECTKKTFISFRDQHLREQVNKMESKYGKKLLHDTFEELFDGVNDLATVEATFVQTAEDASPVVVNVTQFKEPPKQRVEVPGNPCHGAPLPTAETKRMAKCVPGKGQCYKLQERFLNIQAGMKDEYNQLKVDIEMLEEYCKEVRTTLQTEIDDAESMLSESQAKLAKATERISEAMSTARSTAKKNAELDSELKKQMKECNEKYMQYEGEICALRKIRKELYKIKGGGKTPMFQDCEVGKWEPDECTASCGGGTQIIKREVVSNAQMGAACLPTVAKRSCNLHRCPIDCVREQWSGWSTCSAECGEGVQQRSRVVTTAMAFGGKSCGKTSEARSCNTFACEKDCELSEWTEWSICSKDCNGGTQKRTKSVRAPPEGEGTCPDQWAPERLEYKKCNMIGCPVAENVTMPCNNTLDVIVLIDGSGSLGKKGWKAEKKMAAMFVEAFGQGVPAGSPSPANVAVILYSGPRTWSGVRKCVGGDPKVDMEKVCKISTVQRFSRDMKEVKGTIEGLTWPQGSTLTSMALGVAKTLLDEGRQDSKSTVQRFSRDMK